MVTDIKRKFTTVGGIICIEKCPFIELNSLVTIVEGSKGEVRVSLSNQVLQTSNIIMCRYFLFRDLVCRSRDDYVFELAEGGSVEIIQDVTNPKVPECTLHLRAIKWIVSATEFLFEGETLTREDAYWLNNATLLRDAQPGAKVVVGRILRIQARSNDEHKTIIIHDGTACAVITGPGVISALQHERYKVGACIALVDANLQRRGGRVHITVGTRVNSGYMTTLPEAFLLSRMLEEFYQLSQRRAD
ncbi:hypothetical protein MP228_005411 [Amoeboaphelidium protococcarum]|nr:hypothetical protein MP228_005411 [Amoeboaphelidium protococcarum]